MVQTIGALFPRHKRSCLVFINKGNTCYANTILQVLAALPQLWDRPVAALNFPSRLISSFITVVHQHSSTKSARDLSKFLVALENKPSGLRPIPF